MTPEQIKAAVGALTPLAEKLGTTVEYIYAVYRAYQWNYAVANLVAAVLTLTSAIVSWWIIARCVGAKVGGATGDDDDLYWFVAGFVLAIVIPAGLSWIGVVAEDSYLRITNPDYYALQAMLKLVGR